MKNLFNCHSKGLHSFPISCENGLYRRIFYADITHNLHKDMELAIHPHHTDIKITVLDGCLYNYEYIETEGQPWIKKFKWNSHILNGKGGFELLGRSCISLFRVNPYREDESFTMKAHELHTVQLNREQKCVWLVEESNPDPNYTGFNYSIHDLENWTPEGLYLEVPDEVKEAMIGEYLEKIAL